MMIIRAKCIILGDSGVGKSVLLNSFLGDGTQHLKNYLMTLGVDIQNKQIRIPDTSQAVQLFFFDCSGKDYYKNLVKKMSAKASLVLLVYDVTSEESFKAISELYTQLSEANDGQQVQGVLFGNKTDLLNRRRVTPKAGHDLAKKLNLTYFEGSVKAQQGTEAPFFFLANDWHKTYSQKSEILKSIT